MDPVPLSAQYLSPLPNPDRPADAGKERDEKGPLEKKLECPNPPKEPSCLFAGSP
jgi:hypothetical protein